MSAYRGDRLTLVWVVDVAVGLSSVFVWSVSPANPWDHLTINGLYLVGWMTVIGGFVFLVHQGYHTVWGQLPWWTPMVLMVLMTVCALRLVALGLYLARPPDIAIVPL